MTKLLVIDDNRDFLELLNLALKGKFDITTANSLKMVQDMDILYVPDIILSDFHIGTATANDVLEVLSSRMNLYNISITVMSGSDGADFEITVHDDYRFINKPFTVKEIRQLMADIEGSLQEEVST